MHILYFQHLCFQTKRQQTDYSLVILALILKDQFVPFDHFGLHEASATMGLLLFLYAYSYALFWLTERNYRPLRDCLRAKIPRFKLD